MWPLKDGQLAQSISGLENFQALVDYGYVTVTRDIKLFSAFVDVHRKLFCLKLFLGLFAAHEYFPTRSMSIK